MRLRHVVLFRFRPEVPRGDIEQATALLRGLGTLPGIVEWRVEESQDDRKGVVVAENGLFADVGDLEAFRGHPKHREVTQYLSTRADWLVADYRED